MVRQGIGALERAFPMVPHLVYSKRFADTAAPRFDQVIQQIVRPQPRGPSARRRETGTGVRLGAGWIARATVGSARTTVHPGLSRAARPNRVEPAMPLRWIQRRTDHRRGSRTDGRARVTAGAQRSG